MYHAFSLWLLEISHSAAVTKLQLLVARRVLGDGHGGHVHPQNFSIWVIAIVMMQICSKIQERLQTYCRKFPGGLPCTPLVGGPSTPLVAIDKRQLR